MTIEQIFICSRIFMACSIFFIIVAVAFYFIFDIKRLIKILRGKACKPLPRKKEKTHCNKPDNKTELLPMHIIDKTQPLVTVEISSVHSKVVL
jgi:hypothetical protein